MLAFAKMQAHVDKFMGKDLSGNPNRSTLEVFETTIFSNKGTLAHSSVNWHFPGGTRDFWGFPLKDGGL
jgi:hypothetical protein